MFTDGFSSSYQNTQHERWSLVDIVVILTKLPSSEDKRDIKESIAENPRARESVRWLRLGWGGDGVEEGDSGCTSSNEQTQRSTRNFSLSSFVHKTTTSSSSSFDRRRPPVANNARREGDSRHVLRSERQKAAGLIFF